MFNDVVRFTLILLLQLWMLAIGVNHKWDACQSKGQYPSTGPPTYQIIKVPNANHINVMKTSLIIPMCPRELLSHYQKLSRLILFYIKDWATLLHFIYFIYLLLVTIYFITKLSITYYFSACRENLTENRLSFLSTPHWVRHSYLSEGLRYIPYTCGSSAARSDDNDLVQCLMLICMDFKLHKHFE